MTLVPAEARIQDTSGKPNEDAYAHIFLSATAPLEDRWYAVQLSISHSGRLGRELGGPLKRSCASGSFPRRL